MHALIKGKEKYLNSRKPTGRNLNHDASCSMLGRHLFLFLVSSVHLEFSVALGGNSVSRKSCPHFKIQNEGDHLGEFRMGRLCKWVSAININKTNVIIIHYQFYNFFWLVSGADDI